MARQSELDELRKEVEAMRQGQMADMAHPEVNQTFGSPAAGLYFPRAIASVRAFICS